MNAKDEEPGKDPMSTEAPTRPTRQTRSPDKKQLTVWIRSDLHKRMMRLKVEEGDDLREQIEAAVISYLEKRGY